MVEARTLAVCLAFLWGWSEATWFFVVPDVLLTFTALLGWRVVVLATASAALGSMLGAATLYALPEPALQALIAWWKALPVVREAMFSAAAAHLQSGPWGMSEGPAAGIPYRVYVSLCREAGTPLSSVLWVTPWVRLERMIFPPLVALAVLAAMRRLNRGQVDGAPVERNCSIVWGLVWVAIYGYYWGVFLPARFPG